MSGRTLLRYRINRDHHRLLPVLLVLALALVATGGGCTATPATPASVTAASSPALSETPTSGAGQTVETPTSALSPQPPASDTPPPTSTQEAPMTSAEDTTPTPSQDRPQVEQARTDLAARLDLSVAEIEVVEVLSVTWPDGSLGCPQPGMAYKQVPQDGLLIRLRASGQFYNYHSGGGRDPFLCQQQIPSAKSTTLSIEGFITPSNPRLDE